MANLNGWKYEAVGAEVVGIASHLWAKVIKTYGSAAEAAVAAAKLNAAKVIPYLDGWKFEHATPGYLGAA